MKELWHGAVDVLLNFIILAAHVSIIIEIPIGGLSFNDIIRKLNYVYRALFYFCLISTTNRHCYKFPLSSVNFSYRSAMAAFNELLYHSNVAGCSKNLIRITLRLCLGIEVM